jgi:hypothetical protein
MLLTYLLDRSPAELDQHVRSCPSCRAELAALDAQWDEVREAGQVAVTPPPGLVERALKTVRGVRAGYGSTSIKLAQERGVLTVSVGSVLTLARQLCSEVLRGFPEVHLRGCSGDVESVRIDLAIRYGIAGVEVAEQIRSSVDHGMRRSLGAGTPSVWVRLVDVAEPRSG